MIYWPVPNSYRKKVPERNSPGSFWENRQDRYHCGVDIYAPSGSDVVSIDNSYVIKIGFFTKPSIVPYWNETKHIIIKNRKNLYCNYAELSEVIVKEGEHIHAGQLIGYVGTVLNANKITKNSPKYVHKIINNNNPSMLHLEMYNKIPPANKKHTGGNWFGKKNSKTFS
jgi:murein DD-endopeptidase MepM/ murein hydrolase activator NlpD